FAFFQATVPNQTHPNDSLVRCDLGDAGTTLECVRHASGGDVHIEWSVVELAYANVQRVTLDCNVPPAPPQAVLPLPTPVDPSHAFVLSGLTTSGNAYDDDFRASHLVDGGSAVMFENDDSNCSGNWVFSAQVVALAGAVVTRGIATTNDGGLSLTGLDPVAR